MTSTFAKTLIATSLLFSVHAAQAALDSNGLTASNGIINNGLSTSNGLIGQNALTTNALTDNALTDNALTENALTENALTENSLDARSGGILINRPSLQDLAHKPLAE